jgi:hypothetical protein
MFVNLFLSFVGFDPVFLFTINKYCILKIDVKILKSNNYIVKKFLIHYVGLLNSTQDYFFLIDNAFKKKQIGKYTRRRNCHVYITCKLQIEHLRNTIQKFYKYCNFIKCKDSTKLSFQGKCLFSKILF